ncbi:hypothetical protein Plhal304r1_c031g0101091 [Plasmopara halstedii]
MDLNQELTSYGMAKVCSVFGSIDQVNRSPCSFDQPPLLKYSMLDAFFMSIRLISSAT